VPVVYLLLITCTALLMELCIAQEISLLVYENMLKQTIDTIPQQPLIPTHTLYPEERGESEIASSNPIPPDKDGKRGAARYTPVLQEVYTINQTLINSHTPEQIKSTMLQRESHTLTNHLLHCFGLIHSFTKNSSFIPKSLRIYSQNHIDENGINLFTSGEDYTICVITSTAFAFISSSPGPMRERSVYLNTMVLSKPPHQQYSLQTLLALAPKENQRFGIGISPQAQYIAVTRSGRGSLMSDIIIYARNKSEYTKAISHTLKSQKFYYTDRVQFNENESEALLPESSLGSFSRLSLPDGAKKGSVNCLQLQSNDFIDPIYMFAWSSRQKMILCAVGTSTINIYKETGGDPIGTINNPSYKIGSIKTDLNGNFVGYDSGTTMWYYIDPHSKIYSPVLPGGTKSTGNADDLLFLKDEDDKPVIINIQSKEDLPRMEVYSLKPETE